jgi:glycosyltransferase involved in cell wall biosynthesis
MTTSSPSISILMPVYHAVRYLPAALDSMLAQTFSDFELIAIDDGTRDGSAEVLARYAARDARIRVVTQENRGLVASLNRALELARAPLVARMDHDDISRPDRLAKQFAYLRQHPDVAAVSGAMDLIDQDGRYLRTEAYPTVPSAIESELRHGSCVSHPAVMARTAVLRAVGGYRKIVQCAEDYDLWLRVSEISHIGNLPDVVLSYRQHPTKMSLRYYVEQQLAVLAARGAAELRRRGIADPLASADPKSPMSYRALRRMFVGSIPPAELAHPFFCTVLGKTAEQGSITDWSRLYLRYGLWDLDRDAAATIILLLGHLLLRRRRAGAPLGELARFPFWAVVTAICHPSAAVSAAVQARGQLRERAAMRRRERPAKSATAA